MDGSAQWQLIWKLTLKLVVMMGEEVACNYIDSLPKACEWRDKYHHYFDKGPVLPGILCCHSVWAGSRISERLVLHSKQSPTGPTEWTPTKT